MATMSCTARCSVCSASFLCPLDRALYSALSAGLIVVVWAFRFLCPLDRALYSDEKNGPAVQVRVMFLCPLDRALYSDDLVSKIVEAGNNVVRFLCPLDRALYSDLLADGWGYRLEMTFLCPLDRALYSDTWETSFW